MPQRRHFLPVSRASSRRRCSALDRKSKGEADKALKAPQWPERASRARLAFKAFKAFKASKAYKGMAGGREFIRTHLCWCSLHPDTNAPIVGGYVTPANAYWCRSVPHAIADSDDGRAAQGAKDRQAGARGEG